MRLYLAHPLETREMCRARELYIENLSTVDIQNPFYDLKRREIKEMDRLGLDRRSDEFLQGLDYGKIVGTDLILLESCDGVLAYVDLQFHSIGTICELWHGFKHGKIIYIVTPNCASHPWLRFMVERSGGRFFKNMEEFIGWCLINYGK